MWGGGAVEKRSTWHKTLTKSVNAEYILVMKMGAAFYVFSQKIIVMKVPLQ